MYIIFKLAFWFFAVPLGLALVKELYSYLVWRRRYKPQGIPYQYYPFVGYIYYLLV